MPPWLSKVLARIRALAAARSVRFTLKAVRELAGLELGLDEEDACEVLAQLTAADSAGRMASAATGEWMYLFKPQVAETIVYIKVILRNDCVVISFHEDEDGSIEGVE
ncbi:type II toxin-antitoxin system MqsR family toxin [Candidatus Binatus sp.]|uniref:type II toxin-antitoxin system MqsR family toxin n=1 Tax=Candidatus Binatus sp. TaxID=2811406 RepID=UPI003C7708DE